MHNPILRYLEKNQILAALFLVLIAYFLFLIKEIILALFVSYIIMAALYPLVDFLTKKNIPRSISVAIAYVIVLAFLLLLILPLIPFFISQIQVLFLFLPQYLNQSAKMAGMTIDTSRLTPIVTSHLTAIGSNAFYFTQQIFGSILYLLMIFAISYYLLLHYEKIKKNIADLFPKAHRPRILFILSQVEERLGAWLRGQIILSISIAILIWVALTVIGLKFALPLAVLAGVLEIVPTLGPVLSAIPAVIVALSQSPNITIAVIIAYIFIQLAENNFLVPRIMQTALGLNPIVIILGIIIGGNLLGLLGALLSVPFLSMLTTLLSDLKQNSSRK